MEKPILKDKLDIQAGDVNESSQATVQDRGCLNSWSQSAIAILFTLGSTIGLMAYSLGIPISTKGQEKIGGGSYSLLIFGSLVPCTSYTLIAIVIKLGAKCNLTSYDTCHLRWNIGHKYLVMVAGLINTGALGIKLYAGHPGRVHPILQSIFFAISPPATIFWRYVITRKSKQFEYNIEIFSTLFSKLTQLL